MAGEDLKRSITLPMLILYGLGTMVGGGFYALVGKVAGEAGLLAPVALGLSGLFALLGGLAFAELVSRYPVSAGEARYVHEGFNRSTLTRLTGAFVILTGVVSAAALSVATIGFLQDFVSVPQKPAIAILVVAMGGLAAWGIGKSVAVVVTITVIEVGALLYAASVADFQVADFTSRWSEFVPSMEATAWIGIFGGAFLGFYAFIGFEDMVNMAEEVKEPRRVVPIAIVVSIIVTTLLYVVVSLIALLAVPPETLAASNTPVAEMVKGRGWFSSRGLGVVSLLTGVNGALVQIIMASRVGYGMAKSDQAPKWFAKVHPRTQTPVRSTMVIMAVILFLAVFLPLETLAKVTSAIILIVFGTVNVALYRIKKRDPDWDGQGPRLPMWFPLVGAVGCLSVLIFKLWLVVQG
jgi:amino acid transporter